jgi:hypothetical protein
MEHGWNTDLFWLPKFDGIAFWIAKAGEAAVGIMLWVCCDGDTGGAELVDHCVEIADAEINHPLFGGVAEVVGIGWEWSEDGWTGFL